MTGRMDDRTDGWNDASRRPLLYVILHHRQTISSTTSSIFFLRGEPYTYLIWYNNCCILFFV
jgi:hypothetical protein